MSDDATVWADTLGRVLHVYRGETSRTWCGRIERMVNEPPRELPRCARCLAALARRSEVADR